MNNQLTISDRLYNTKISVEACFLFLFLWLYKIVLEYGYVKILIGIDVFALDFNLNKYIVGAIWISVLYFLIDQDRERVSTFLMNFHLFVSMVPITLWYAFCNGSSAYYNLVCFCFGLTALFLRKYSKKQDIKENKLIIRISNFPQLIIIVCLLVMFAVTGIVVATQGPPTLTAMDIKAVYSIRSEHYFITNAYLGYIYDWMMKVIAPFILAVTLVKRKYLFSLFTVMFVAIFYLYSGNKTTLFSVFLVIGTYVVLRFKNGRFRFFEVLTGAVVVTTLAMTKLGIYMPYSLFIRRTLIIPARLKFCYFDFFSKNPNIGNSGFLFSGDFTLNPYSDDIGNLIGQFYANNPDTNANTGFMVEGYERYGIIGMLIAFFIFAVILILVDKLQDRAGYMLAACIAIYPVFILNDVQLIGNVIFGFVMILVLICMLYYDNDAKEGKLKHGIKICAR